MWDQLLEVGKKVLENPKNKVLLLRGSGDQFTAGSDLKEFHQMTVRRGRKCLCAYGKHHFHF